jgi:hypothetical protein
VLAIKICIPVGFTIASQHSQKSQTGTRYAIKIGEILNNACKKNEGFITLRLNFKVHTEFQ